MRSKTMILREFSRQLSCEDLEAPRLAAGQLLVRMSAAGICGSDVHMWLGKDPRTPVPMILGHEGTGVVEDTCGTKRALDGEPLAPGDRILWNRGVVCGSCYWCTTAGQPELCPERWVYGIHRSINQPTYLNGCYGEYVVLDERTDVFRLPRVGMVGFDGRKDRQEIVKQVGSAAQDGAGPGAPCGQNRPDAGGPGDPCEQNRPDAGGRVAGADSSAGLPEADDAIFVPASCSGATIAHAFDCCPPPGGATVLVQGPGPLGVFAVAFARAFGAGRIIVVGGTDERLEMCERAGADVVLNRKHLDRSRRRQAVMDHTGGRGVDWALEAVGSPEAVKEGIELTRRGGTYVSTGVGTPVGSVELDLYRDIELKNLRLQGIWVSHTRHTGMALDLIKTRPDFFRTMVTHRFGLEDATRALESVERRQAVKAVLVPCR